MPERWSDEDVRRALAELRHHDEQSAPEFDTVWERARASATHRRASRTLRLAAAAAMLLIIGGAVLLARSRGRSAGPSETDIARATPLSQWRSPTAFLLDGASDDLLRTVPLIPAMPPELRLPTSARTHPGDS